MNSAAERHLGCTADDLDQALPLWDQVDVHLEDGTRLADLIADSQPVEAVSFGPIGVQLVGRTGLISRGELTLRSVVDPHGISPMMLAIFRPASGRSWGVRSSRRWSTDVVFSSMTARQREILALLMQGQRVPAIVAQLFLSRHTVRNHLKVLFRKVGVGSQVELIELARRRNEN